MKKISFLLILIVIATCLFAGCDSTPSTTTSSTTTSSTSTTATTTSTSAIKTGGTLRMVAGVFPNTMPGWPAEALNSQKQWAYWVVFEGLVKIDMNGQPIPWLATDWKFGPQNAYIDFNLRNDVKFTDGTNFTAESVVTHVNQLFTDADSCVKYWDRTEKTGDYSVRIYLKQYRNDFWSKQLGAWSMLFTSDTQLKEKGLEYAKTHPVGTGPFILQTFEKDVAMEYVKNPNYWQAGKPYLDGITFSVVKEILTQQAQMDTKEADLICAMSDGKVIKDETEKGRVIVNKRNSCWYMQFDNAHKEAPTSNPKVRMAIEHALNKDEMTEVLGMGSMVTANQLAGPDASDLAFNPNLGTRDYDVAKAKQLLKEAGYEDGFTFNIIADLASPSIQGAVVMVQNYLKEVGITVTIEAVDNAKMWNYLRTGMNGGIITNFGMAADMATHLSNLFPPWRTNLNLDVEFPQDVVDTINAAMVETDQSKLKAMNYELSQWIWDNALFIPISAFGQAYIFQPYVKDSGHLEYLDWNIWNPELCWLDR